MGSPPRDKPTFWHSWVEEWAISNPILELPSKMWPNLSTRLLCLKSTQLSSMQSKVHPLLTEADVKSLTVSSSDIHVLGSRADVEMWAFGEGGPRCGVEASCFMWHWCGRGLGKRTLIAREVNENSLCNGSWVKDAMVFANFTISVILQFDLPKVKLFTFILQK